MFAAHPSGQVLPAIGDSNFRESTLDGWWYTKVAAPFHGGRTWFAWKNDTPGLFMKNLVLNFMTKIWLNV
jgi:hypothetical protein